MSLLSKSNILDEIQQNRIVIEPPIQPDQINGASIDLTLGDEFRIFSKCADAIDILEQTDYKHFTTWVSAQTILLHPQETILAITLEKISLPNNIVGWLEGRSRFARLGLLIHISAGLVHPGVNNRQVLEITNLSPNTLRLHAGERICQLVLEYSSGAIQYSGKFKSQINP